jgi:hypothetical protein
MRRKIDHEYFSRSGLTFPFVKLNISKEHDDIKIFLKLFRPVEFSYSCVIYLDFYWRLNQKYAIKT